MDARIQELPFDPAALRRLSPGLINSHHQNNYGGAVKRLNAIRQQLAATAFATAPGFQLNGLKREELIATNSMLLHELYFGSLGGDGVSMEPAMKLALDANFGSVERWRDEFVAMGKALGGGSGWVLQVWPSSCQCSAVCSRSASTLTVEPARASATVCQSMANSITRMTVVRRFGLGCTDAAAGPTSSDAPAVSGWPDLSPTRGFESCQPRQLVATGSTGWMLRHPARFSLPGVAWGAADRLPARRSHFYRKRPWIEPTAFGQPWCWHWRSPAAARHGRPARRTNMAP